MQRERSNLSTYTTPQYTSSLDRGRLTYAMNTYSPATNSDEHFKMRATSLELLNEEGHNLFVAGDLTAAKKMFQRASTECTEGMGENDLSITDVMNNMGLVCVFLGELTEARRLLERALRVYESKHGRKHLSTLGALNNLGILDATQGHLESAKTLFQLARTGFEEMLGSDHEAALDAENNLGLVYLAIGDLPRAANALERALEQRLRRHGTNHISTTDTLNNLGLVYMDQDKHSQAREKLLQAVDGKVQLLGPDHISTLGACQNLALAELCLGNLEKAERLLQSALNRSLNHHTRDCTSTCVITPTIMWSYASLRAEQGRLNEAMDWYEKALCGYHEVYGNDHSTCRDLREEIKSLWCQEGMQIGHSDGGFVGLRPLVSSDVPLWRSSDRGYSLRQRLRLRLSSSLTRHSRIQKACRRVRLRLGLVVT